MFAMDLGNATTAPRDGGWRSLARSVPEEEPRTRLELCCRAEPEDRSSRIVQVKRSRMMLSFLVWFVLLVICWPLALLAVVAYPVLWLFCSRSGFWVSRSTEYSGRCAASSCCRPGCSVAPADTALLETLSAGLGWACP
jgi:hypothetical protein